MGSSEDRRYYLFKDGKRRRVPSVTTVLRNIGNKDALMNWHYKQGLQAVDNAIETLIEQLEDEPIRPSRLFSVMPPYAENAYVMPKPEAEIGTILHAMVECDVKGLEFVRDIWPPDLLERADVAFQGWLTWKGQNNFETEASEEKLVSFVHEYGGRQDLTNLVAGCNGRRVLMDIKTGRAVYEDAWLQLGGYDILWHEAYQTRPLAAHAVLRLSKEDGGISYNQRMVTSPKVVAAKAGFLAALFLYKQVYPQLRG